MRPVLKKATRLSAVSLAQLVEQLTLNQWVEGSSPSGDTTKSHPSRVAFLVVPYPEGRSPEWGGGVPDKRGNRPPPEGAFCVFLVKYLVVCIFCCIFAHFFTITVMKQSGSNRIYSREVDPCGKTFIRVQGTSRTENHAFITMARHFRQLGLPVPEIYTVSDDEMTYTQQDLGDTLLFDYIKSGRETGKWSDDEIAMLSKTIRQLAHIQVEGAKNMDWSVCYPVPAFDRKSIFWDLNYFKYDFLKLTNIDFSEPELEADFERLADDLLSVPCDVFMYRDFQSRNVMIYQNEPYFIDFQGGRRGPIYYDLASFLWQAKANFPQALRDQLLDAYFDELEKIDHPYLQIVPYQGKESTSLNHQSKISIFVLFRTLQVLGAYGFRGLFEHKQHFIESIPLAINNLCELFDNNPELQQTYPTLHILSRELRQKDGKKTAKGRQKDDNETLGKAEATLTVDILSFSFKKGLPEDPSGNGGGYIFDCRSTHNPGKYDQYKQLTGLDKPVIEFLESDGEILTFLESVYALVDHHVERFLERGFTHLQIAFGCTGGQHRSVYSAESTARHLRAKFPETNIQVTHRELSAQ